MKIQKVAEQVKDILEQKPKARDDDFLLYGFVLNKYGVSMSIPFSDLARLVKDKEIPSMDSVGRARRKAQELYTELRGNVYAERINNETEFVEFAMDERI